MTPFGIKQDYASGESFDFDAIYRDLFKPAIELAGMEPIREDDIADYGVVGHFDESDDP